MEANVNDDRLEIGHQNNHRLPIHPVYTPIHRTCHGIWNTGIVCIAIAAAIYSIAAALVRPLSPSITVFEIVAVRSTLSLMFSVVLYIFFTSPSTAQNTTTTTGVKPPFFGHPPNMPALAMRGLVGAAAMDCFYASIQRLPLADAVAVMFLNPVITAVLAFYLLKEPLSWRGFAGCFGSLLGMVLVVRPPFLFGSQGHTGSSSTTGTQDQLQPPLHEQEQEQQRLIGALFGLASAFLAAGAYLSIRIIGNKETPLTVAVWFHLAASLHSYAFCALSIPHPPVLPTPKDWACLVSIACSSFSANILLNRGFQIESAAVASGVNVTQVLYSHLIGVLVFGEALRWMGGVGAALIALGVVVVSIDSKRAKQQQQRVEEEEEDDEMTRLIGRQEVENTSSEKSDQVPPPPPPSVQLQMVPLALERSLTPTATTTT